MKIKTKLNKINENWD